MFNIVKCFSGPLVSFFINFFFYHQGFLNYCLHLYCFGQYVLRPSSGVCRTLEPTQNFELHSLLNPQGSTVLIPLTITGYKC